MEIQGATQNPGDWAQVHDGNWPHLDIDKSVLAGKNGKFTLLVFNNSSSYDEQVF